jgi:hypothetical protein
MHTWRALLCVSLMKKGNRATWQSRRATRSGTTCHESSGKLAGDYEGLPMGGPMNDVDRQTGRRISST